MKLILLGLLAVVSQTATAIPETPGEKPVVDFFMTDRRKSSADLIFHESIFTQKIDIIATNSKIHI